MSIWTQILVTAATAAVTVVVTAVITYILNGPKRRQQQKEQEHEEIMERIETLEKNINGKMEQQDKQRAELKASTDLLKLGTQAIIKNELKLRYEYWIQEQFAPMDAKDDLERMYCIYHQLGANGVMDALREQFLDLPDKPPKNNK